jgi:hypothetical protein
MTDPSAEMPDRKSLPESGQHPFWRFPRRFQCILLAILITAFAVTAVVPAWRHLNSDFPNYYLVARLYREGYPLDRVYEWIWLQRQKDHRAIDQGVITFVPLTLPSALVVAPLTSLSPLGAKRCWLFANLLFLILIGLLLTRITTLHWLHVALLMSLSFFALRNNFLLGQLHLLLLLLLTLAAWLHFRKQHFWGGLTLAVTAALKLYPGLFLIFFIFKRQWRAAAGLVTGLLVSVAISLYLFGKGACEVYVREILPSSLRGETVDPYHPAWGSITTLLRRLFIAEPELNPAPVAHLPWLFALLQPAIHTFIFVAFMWAIGPKTGDDRKIKRDWVIYLFLLLFLSSQPAGYHFVVLILTTLIIFDEMVLAGRTEWAFAVTVFYALICTATMRLPAGSAHGWYTLMYFPRLYLMAILGGILFVWMFSSSATSIREQLHSKSAAIAGLVALILVTLGFFSTRRHLKGQFENYAHRVLTAPGSLFAAFPALSDHDITASVMTVGGYTLRRVDGPRVWEITRTMGDWLHPTTSQDPNSLWAEQASRYGSRVVRFTDAALLENPTAVSELSDAEEPVVSPDGKLIAFFREVRGRDTLWLQSTGLDAAHDSSVQAHQIAGEQYDPREATFLPDHRLLFSSKRAGKFALYVAALSGTVEELKNPTCAARYPAASADGKWIAFSCEERGNWQVHALHLEEDRDVQLTTGECNSITPAWSADSSRLIYATDCGRGVGLTALAELPLPR